MFIISKKIKEPQYTTDEIINIIFGYDNKDVEEWILNYINNDITSLKYNPNEKYISNEKYNILEKLMENKENLKIYELRKTYNKLVKGYLFNSYESCEELVYTIEIKVYNKNIEPNSLLWKNINNEINIRLLKKMDKKYLIDIIYNINKKLTEKDIWNTDELIILQNNMLQKYFYHNFLKLYQKQKLD